MKIAVIGAGIIGVTTAYELAQDGHDVTVFERRIAAAEESSFAPSGLISPAHFPALPLPHSPLQILSDPLRRHPAGRVHWPLSRQEIRWLWQHRRSRHSPQAGTGTADLRWLGEFSHSRQLELSAKLQLEYDRSEGRLVLLRTEADLQRLQPALQELRDAGVSFKVLSESDTRRLEPGLNLGRPFQGALHFAQDEVSNCRQFVLLLKNESQRIGVKFEFSSAIERLESHQGVRLSLSNAPTPKQFDAAVLCAGLGSAQLLAPLGRPLPMAAIYGYSISAGIRESLNAPRSAVLDERHHVLITRLGNRVRVCGGASIGGQAQQHNAAALRTLYKVLQDWFPGAAQLGHGVQTWKGARPMLPDGRPVLGASGIDNVWLNTGHADYGWELGCGSARLLAQKIAGRTTPVELERFALERWSK